MKMLRYALFGLLVLGMTACTHRRSEPTTAPAAPAVPAAQTVRTATPAPIPAPRAEEAVEQTPVAPVQPQQPAGPSAAATQAAAQQVSPVAPGLRVARVQVPGMYVALTFDDGPSASLTPRVLDILRRNNAVGTFFVLGQNAALNRSVVARAAAEGNEIGVHTWSHIKMTGSSLAKVDSEISRTRSVIAEITGRTPLVMRPPYGAINGGLVNRMRSEYGMRTILWDVDTLDWRHPGVQKVINTAVGQAKPGSIILVHDIHASTVAALEGIVQGLQARGFKLVTVSQLISLANRAAGQSANAVPGAPAYAPAPAVTPAPEVTVPAEPQPETVPEPPVAPAAETLPSAPAPVTEPATVPEPATVTEAVPTPAPLPLPAPAIRPATESGAAAISATSDAAAEEISEPDADEAPAPAAADGAASIAGQEDSL